MVPTVGKPGPQKEEASNALLGNINGHVKMILKLKKISNIKEKREKKINLKKEGRERREQTSRKQRKQ